MSPGGVSVFDLVISPASEGLSFPVWIPTATERSWRAGRSGLATKSISRLSTESSRSGVHNYVGTADVTFSKLRKDAGLGATGPFSGTPRWPPLLTTSLAIRAVSFRVRDSFAGYRAIGPGCVGETSGCRFESVWVTSARC